jgi:hypothetical protein
MDQIVACMVEDLFRRNPRLVRTDENIHDITDACMDRCEKLIVESFIKTTRELIHGAFSDDCGYTDVVKTRIRKAILKKHRAKEYVAGGEPTAIPTPSASQIAHEKDIICGEKEMEICDYFCKGVIQLFPGILSRVIEYEYNPNPQ